MSAKTICCQCGSTKQPVKRCKGSLGVEILCWLLFLLPGLLYSLWRQQSYRKVCADCGAETLVPLNSPMGKKLAAELGIQNR